MLYLKNRKRLQSSFLTKSYGNIGYWTDTVKSHLSYLILKENLRSRSKINLKCPFTEISKIVYRAADLLNNFKVQETILLFTENIDCNHGKKTVI